MPLLGQVLLEECACQGSMVWSILEQRDPGQLISGTAHSSVGYHLPKRKEMAPQALRVYSGHWAERRGHELFLLVVREFSVSSPASLRVKWQEEEKRLQLVCGEVSRVGSENVGVGRDARSRAVTGPVFACYVSQPSTTRRLQRCLLGFKRCGLQPSPTQTHFL